MLLIFKSISTFFCLFSILFQIALTQDGSSELVAEKTISTLNRSTRIRCTDDNLKLYANASVCPDEREPESCRMVFTMPSGISPATRDSKCDNPLLKDLADQCRRTCAICCEDPSYACQNDESGIVNCSQNMEKCGMAEFSAMMIKFCPATCGLCLAKKCKDQIPECDTMRSLCTNEIYATFMQHQCARTCGKCKSEEDEDEERKKVEKGGENSEEEAEKEEEESIEDKKVVEKEKEVEPIKKNREKNNRKNGGFESGTTPSSTNSKDETCVDLIKTCHRNKKFCHHVNYKEMMRKNCARTCGFCKPKRGSPPVSSDCKDNHPFCKGWAANGYCDSDEYSEEEKEEKCAKTCGYC